MDRILQWNTLQEAADYLSGELGGNWTPRQVLDAGEQQSFKVCFILPHDVKALAGRMEEWVGEKPELMPVCINELLNSERVRVGFVPFIEHATNRETVLELKPRPTISFDEIRISGSELKNFAASERAANKTPAMKILFEKHLCPREFGSAVFNVPDLLKWTKGKGVCLPTEPPLDAYDFAQAEYVLSLVANFPFHNAAADEAAAHVATNPVLAQHKAAEVAPEWLAGAEAATQWRAAFSKAIANGELILLDRFSLLPVAIANAPAAQSALAAKVEAVRLPVATQQNNAILNWLKVSQHAPLKLPVPPSGKAGVKKLCRDALCKSSQQLFSSASVFNTAWDRLRANDEIKDASDTDHPATHP